MNKRAVFFICLILGIILIINLVSAQSPVEDIKKFIIGAKDVLEKLAETLLGPGPTGTEGGLSTSYLFARVLFLIIIFVVVWSVVNNIPLFNNNLWIISLISAAVSLLSTRFLLQPEWVKTILLPYTTLGIALTSFIPLLIYFYFVETAIESRVMRKIAWVLAAVIFIGLWVSRYSELTGAAYYIYPITAAACLLFLLLDGTIKHFWEKARAEAALSPTKYILYGNYMDQIKHLMTAQTNFPVGSKKYKDIQSQIDDLQKKAVKIIK